MDEKGIKVVPEFYLERVDNEAKKLISYDGQELPFDLLVSIPTNKGADMVETSEMGDTDELNFIPTNKETLQSLDWPNIFVIGDASNIPASKAGSVIHFEAEIVLENILHFMAGEPLSAKFDGHANCFIETGFSKAALIDFDYTTEPLPGKFPYGALGPMDLLKETRLNHWGKLAFKWVYWHFLLKGHEIPTIHSAFSLKGKQHELLTPKSTPANELEEVS
jgi:sulfide:quinone oxidoreductase